MIKRQILATYFFIFMAIALINGVSAEDGVDTCSTDNIAPTIENVNPANNSVNVPDNTVIKVNFSENITEGNTTIQLKNSNGALIPISTSIDGTVLTITPLAKLLAGIKYTIILNNNSITDLAGNGLEHCTSNFTVSPMKAYWMWASGVAGSNASDLHAKGITDVFILVRGTTGKTYLYELQQAINKFHPVGIKVHAWVVCFKDSNGNFVNPSGYYSYTKKVYVKTIKYLGKKKVTYRVWKKVKWKKIKGKWKYKWKKVIKYRYKSVWLYKKVYKDVIVKGYNQTFNNNLVNFIKTVTTSYNIDGIHLDYVRYSGVASKNHAAWQEPGGETAGVNAVTGFVSRVKTTIKSFKPNILLSAAVMPEGAKNAYLYGQNYTRLADYLDFLVPMIYEESYNANNDWITHTTQYIVDHAKGKPVYAGLTTYVFDSISNGYISDPDLSEDIQSVKLGGAAGYVLFRYGLGSYIPTF